MNNRSNIILIGMPGSGKSTIGIILAKIASMDFLDTDILIQNRTGRTLQEIVNTEGHMQLRTIEEEALLSISCLNHVIATGGSAPYSEKAMIHLKRNGTIVFLDATLSTLEKRILNFNTRGLAKRPEQTLTDLFLERNALYKKYADVTVDCNNQHQEKICEEILLRIKEFRNTAN